MNELEKYKAIGTTVECRKAMNHYKATHEPRHKPDENCKTCKDHDKCSYERYSMWCINYARRIDKHGES